MGATSFHFSYSLHRPWLRLDHYLDLGGFWERSTSSTLSLINIYFQSLLIRQGEDRPLKGTLIPPPPKTNFEYWLNSIKEMRLELTCLVYLLFMMAILTSGFNGIVSGRIRAPKYGVVTTLLIGFLVFLMSIQQLFTCLPRQQLNTRHNFSITFFPKNRIKGFDHVILALWNSTSCLVAPALNALLIALLVALLDA